MEENIIMGGYFNLIVKVAETWGEGSRKDTLDGSFTQLFAGLDLCDMEPNELVPTWRNYRSNGEGVKIR